ncbi:MAG: helix-turn-helix domain-containing protein [Clostridia bacterium]|nr:helix-turn-helix domain-containing protein [Clostridia bacterium]
MKTKRHTDKEHAEKQFYKAILLLEEEVECRAFFADVCTDAEVAEMSRRWLAAVMLAQGESYLDVAESTGLSTATISRVSRALKNGSGYAGVLARMKEKGEEKA